MRVSGLVSGMDIDKMVNDLMKVNRMPLDKLKQKKQILEWQRDDFRSINTLMLGFRKRLTDLQFSSNYQARTVSTSDEAKVTATVASGAAKASYSIESVSQLAKAAYRIGNKITPDGEKIDLTQNLWSQSQTVLPDLTWNQGVVETKYLKAPDGNTPIDLELNGASISNNELNVKVNGKVYEVVTSGVPEKGQVLYDVGAGTLSFGESLPKGSSVRVDYAIAEKTISHTASAEQSNWRLGKGAISELTVTIDGTAYTMDPASVDDAGFADLGGIGKVHVLSGEIQFNDPLAEGSELTATFKQNYSSFTIGSHQATGKVEERIFFAGNESMNGVIKKVNESSAGVTMFYDSFKDQMTLTRKETGDFNNGGDGIILSGQFLTDVLKFSGTTESRGQNAVFTVNGLTTERQSNTFSMNGVTFTLKQTFTDPVSVAVSNDTNTVVETIKSFVNEYNELIGKINDKLTEERYRKYTPLTDDEERDKLTEKQQEKWEEMARSGLLKSDPTLTAALSQMRLDMYSSVETNGTFKQLTAIGITTTFNYRDGGKLEINEAKLKEAVEKDPEAVENLFRGPGTSDSDKGIVNKLYDTVDQTIKRIQTKAGRATSMNKQFAIGKELIEVDKNIDRFEKRLKMVEDRLWRQFSAMERSILQSNNQAMYLMQQFGM
ncbi:flagellar hook-associated protein 2 [Bacillus thermophilus]|uniref:Flagellar hook-associated protein 2 n=1 Tax=Siminovitchia thermophila TaxID=1245522 RepID=A0ABS2R4X0_9BACI|nr:flagellar filament capping protein FliD [Siminovitchia thermophila]MBM7714204.1 flagellar hook-associated protein 2 [Siminovitchia thermophila]ONK23380.1 hypothetical protein BLX87_10965 [Bacillus sp. VT-16-64]